MALALRLLLNGNDKSIASKPALRHAVLESFFVAAGVCAPIDSSWAVAQSVSTILPMQLKVDRHQGPVPYEGERSE
jgi:hypothetical protein